MSSEKYREVNLLEYLPQYLQEYRELKVISEVEKPELESLFTELDLLGKRQFISTCDEVGIEKFEKLLGLPTIKGEKLESRKARVMVRWLEDIPYTFETLEKQLEQLCGVDGYITTLDNKAYFLEVLVKLNVKERFEDVQQLLSRIVPCNIRINTFIDYNKYITFKPFMYKEVGRFTHKELRERVIEIDKYLNKNGDYVEVNYLYLVEFTNRDLRRKGEWYGK